MPNEHHRDFEGLWVTQILMGSFASTLYYEYSFSLSLKKQAKGSSKTNPGVMMNYQPKLHALEKSFKLPIELHHFFPLQMGGAFNDPWKIPETQQKPSWWFQPVWKILVKLDHCPR